MSAEVIKMSNQDKDRNIALESAIGQIEKAFGKGSVMKLGDQTVEKVESISSGSIGLDIALCVGGDPKENGECKIMVCHTLYVHPENNNIKKRNQKRENEKRNATKKRKTKSEIKKRSQKGKLKSKTKNRAGGRAQLSRIFVGISVLPSLLASLLPKLLSTLSELARLSYPGPTRPAH